MLDVLQRLADSDSRHAVYLHEDFVEAPCVLRYGELAARVAACAAHFRAQGVQPGERVVFPFETSEATILSFFGLLELGAVPFSVKPFLFGTPRQAYRDFLGRIAETHGVTRILDVPSLKDVELPLRRVPLPPGGARLEGARLRALEPDALLFVQFSSGSTSFPKGVPITWRNLEANLRMISTQGRIVVEDVGMSWLPLFHDMGLVGGLMGSLYGGQDMHLSQPQAFLMEPLGWLEFLSEHRCTLAVIPNFAIDYTLKQLREAEPEALARIDLSALRLVFLGSEPINISNLEEFTRLLAPRGLRRESFTPCYGLAEAVLMVSARPQGEGWRVVTGPNGQQAVSVGRVLSEFEVRLRTEDGRECGERELGEVELRGGSLADGYYGNTRPLRGEDGFYATGDLGFLDGGELFITGRAGDRIKLNGQSYFSSDFEQAVERLPFIRAGRSAVIYSRGKLVVLAEVNAPAALEQAERSRRELCDVILERVGVKVAPEDVLFIRYGQLLKTSSGKLQRRAITEAYEQGRIRTVTPRELRADLLRMRAQRLFYGSLFEARRRGRALLGRGSGLLRGLRKTP